MVDDAEGGGERVVLKSPGAAVRVEVSSSTGFILVYHDGSQDPLVSSSTHKQLPTLARLVHRLSSMGMSRAA